MILADTGFWVALANRADKHHARARTALAKHPGPYTTTWPVMTETCHLLASRLGTDAQLAFVRSASLGAFEIFALEAAHLPRVEGPEHARFLAAMERAETYVEDRLAVLRRRRDQWATRYENAEQRRDAAVGAETRDLADDQVTLVGRELDAMELRIRRLELREDETFQLHRQKLHANRGPRARRGSPMSASPDVVR